MSAPPTFPPTRHYYPPQRPVPPEYWTTPLALHLAPPPPPPPPHQLEFQPSCYYAPRTSMPEPRHEWPQYEQQQYVQPAPPRMQEQTTLCQHRRTSDTYAWTRQYDSERRFPSEIRRGYVPVWNPNGPSILAQRRRAYSLGCQDVPRERRIAPLDKVSTPIRIVISPASPPPGRPEPLAHRDQDNLRDESGRPHRSSLKTAKSLSPWADKDSEEPRKVRKKLRFDV